MRELHERLLVWWTENQRDYPWRKTSNPYHVLVAEVLLHRTRADQVVPLYTRLIERYPTVQDLSKARLEDVRALLASAGLVWRVDLLLQCASEIESRFGGRVPESSEELQSLPGVGHYIASAVRCFAYGHSDAVVDTNTVRIASRLLGFATTDASRRSPAVRKIIQDLLDPARARELNFAMLDFGALVCRSGRPQCSLCPLLHMCTYGIDANRGS